MKITIVKNETEFDCISAWRIIREMLINPKAVIGLSTGKTTKNIHLNVSRIHKQDPFDISGITLFGLDEVTNVPREYAGACFTMLKTEIIDPLGIPEHHFIMPPTYSDDFNKEALLFQRALEARGGIDLQILGLGTNGHLGFNQPGTPFESEAWHSFMDKELESRIRKETGTAQEIPLGGLTLGIKNIMHARKIILVAKGESKAEIVKKMLHGPVTTDIPASVLQLHPDCEFILDTDAARLL
ncbi:MAG: glucosamine-6-phosphate deaminase [Tannerella sp.]|jgi:glucosamine-6-phosphate deaminase|nr:glucosamine-6-phosphate deaminase [Tannerella sp.]